MVPEGRENIMAGEHGSKQHGGQTGSWEVTTSITSRKQREQTGGRTKWYTLKSLLQWHTSLKQGRTSRTSPNSVTNWGPSVQRPEPLGVISHSKHHTSRLLLHLQNGLDLGNLLRRLIRKTIAFTVALSPKIKIPTNKSYQRRERRL